MEALPVSQTLVPATPPRENAFLTLSVASRPALFIALALALSSAVAFALLPVLHDWAELGPVWIGLVGLAAMGRCIELHRSEVIGACFQLLSAFFLICLLGSLAGSVLATTAMPLVDPMLARADAVIGFDWLATFQAWETVPNLYFSLSVIYSSLAWQPVVLLGLLAASGRIDAAWQFLTAWGLSLLTATLIFPFFPAHANFVIHGIDPGDAPEILVPAGWLFAETFDSLRAGAIVLIGREHLDGLVTFPSFHTSAAILLAAGFAYLRRLAWPFAIWNALMIVSAVFVGAHYLVDVLAGIIVALGGLLAAQRLVPVKRV
ncbi:MAG: phosphatase PAP2 family protein [Erythrobacter sp.]|uniref:phosphatase PAP2 family protein n=1 Tax=Erythrobacter sp. TaxID=1042 RepID=UPI001B2B8BE8|nr:phosphatase PAP2 family protein [Erythrobacter sp.]MBO6767219.1 phosphatase PAP2 family protein [Erythrobacter sp.]